MANEIRIIPIRGIGEIRPGDDLAGLVVETLLATALSVQPGDILVITQKIVSKAEGRLVDLASIEPSAFAHQIAAQGHKDARHQEVVLRESRRIVRMDRGVLITETHQGLVCANAGVDESNVAGGRLLALLPVDPDASAAALRTALHTRTGVDLAVIISDTFGRPWREGQVNVAIGVSGLAPVLSFQGVQDPYGYELRATAIAVADELAAAAELVMGKLDRVPAAIVRGYQYQPGDQGARALIRDPALDLFR